MKILISILFCLFTGTMFAQNVEVWKAFEVVKGDTTFVGFKDKGGHIKIPAKFDDFLTNRTLKNISSVSFLEDSSKKFGYLLRNGNIVGIDSCYMDGDYSPDKESEETIRFETRNPKGMGFFDKDGKVLIPAMYNYVSPFTNGYAYALFGAKRSCNGKIESDAGCEHWWWIGGESLLINKQNKIIIKNWDSHGDSNLDFYSVKIDEKVDTSIYKSYKGEDNRIYSFLDYEKQFNKWLKKDFYLNFKTDIGKYLFEEIRLDFPTKKKMNDVVFTKRKYLRSNHLNRMKELLEAISNSDTTLSTSLYKSDLFGYYFDRQKFKNYNNDNDLLNINKYPIFELNISNSEKFSFEGSNKKFNNATIEFIRIDSSYQIIGFSYNEWD